MSLITRRGTAAAASAASIALLLAACSSSTGEESAAGSADAETVTVEHAQGSTEVPADPQRVVVLDFGALDTIDALGLGGDVVGLPLSSPVPDFLSAYEGEKYTDVGTLQEPDYEAIARLDPDLVVVGFRSAAAYPELAKTYPTVDVTFGYANFLDEFGDSARILGEIFGKEDEVEKGLADIAAEAEQIRPLGEAAGAGMVLSTSGGEVTMYGEDSRFGPIFTELGVADAVSGVENTPHGEVVSFEMIRDTNPDWLFVNDRDAAVGQGEGAGQAAQQVLDNELVASTTAWQSEQVVYLDPQRWYIAQHGLSNVAAMFDEVGQALGA
ncbi:siderophore ABC transporter substrate-binding protein [Georgenia sp. SYP-B2076]|uniref:siderophore ABC transporter substrate-binding protein n=1 Tax=Georgenia sp. SYP-B2076 TaxID=2495881 RepID=UPI0013DFE4A1|nr:siderophore ABC transporter substrate-binding protein [Georgenia sp. SYP-B2076]